MIRRAARPIAAMLFAFRLLLTAGLAFAYTGDFAILGDREIRDQNGREIRVAEPFDRIISLYGAHTENLFSLGLDSEIIGVSRSEVYPPEALTKPVFSYHDDPERFLAARPDLVIIRPMIDRGYFQLVDRLEKSGITVVSLQPATAGEIFRYWKILGILTGRSEAAEAMIDRFSSAVAEIRSVTDPISPKRRVYFEAIGSRMKTFSPDSVAIFALSVAGGINVADDAEPSRGTNVANYGKERILAHADEIDVYLAQHGTMNRPTVAGIKAEPGFSIIKAVREGEIRIVDEALVARPTLRLLEGIWAIGQALYPDRFGPALRKTVTEAING